MLKFIVPAALLAAGYWYYSGPYQASRLVSPGQLARDSERAMERCLRQERSISAGGAMAGALMVEEDVEWRCAEKLDFVQRDGQWSPRER